MAREAQGPRSGAAASDLGGCTDGTTGEDEEKAHAGPDHPPDTPPRRRIGPA
ncbi:hypothetical protein [Pseudofrankia inefficax]|uniref:Nuclear receptor subfamily 1, group H, member 3-like protein n=1 Tax=Pseudofrankia inefficax (strain DSM 45817 / CECT 9037 / DDB 130130 / EuI1c) TaxID=298654 RepID=E3J1W1_PSEI1|nr:hypothetical protein [Pseudofrankia inefficax]ADP82919.1 nuclear receptor subfamily 1, group H, member 3-like protein [Pseudofrankia inefficax]